MRKLLGFYAVLRNRTRMLQNENRDLLQVLHRATALSNLGIASAGPSSQQSPCMNVQLLHLLALRQAQSQQSPPCSDAQPSTLGAQQLALAQILGQARLCLWCDGERLLAWH